MLKSIMSSTRVNKVSSSKLLNGSQPLKLRCVHDFDTKRVDLDVAMDWVIHYLKNKVFI